MKINKRKWKNDSRSCCKIFFKYEGCDIMDQNLENLDIKQKSYKWWKPIFYYILEITINNSFIIYNKSGFKNDRLKFKRNLIEQLCIKKENIEEKGIKSFNYNLYKLDHCIRVNSYKKKRCRLCQKQTSEIR